MRKLIAISAAATALMLSGTAFAQSSYTQPKPVIVLVHGQLDDPATWSDFLTDATEGNPVATSATFDLRATRDTRADKDDASAVVRSISAQLAPNGRLLGDTVELAAGGQPPRVQLAAVSQKISLR